MTWAPAQGTGTQSGGSVLSDGNTTTTPLSSGATFTGAWERAPSDGVTVSCKADNTGTLYFDFSNDGVNADTFPTNGFEVADGIHEYHTARVNSRYFRVRFVNDTGAQTYLRLYTYYGTHTQPNAPINQAAGTDQDATWVRPTIGADEIRIGKRAGVEGWTKFAHRDDLAAASGEQTIWAATGNFTPLESPSTFDIAYDGTGGGSTDGAGTNGALSIVFYYIDSSGNPAIATHTLGTDGADTTSFSGYGINRAAVASSGSDNYNASDITITATTGGSTQAVIPSQESVTEQAIFFNGHNHDAVAKYLFINTNKQSGGSPKVTIKGYVFNVNVTTRYEVFRYTIDTAVENSMTISEPVGFNLSPSDVLYFVADTDRDSTILSMRFSLVMYARA